MSGFERMRVSEREGGKAPTLVQTIISVLASFFGVQNRKNRERDFKHGNPAVFIAVGLVMTVLFIFGVIAAVRIMLSQSGL